MNSGRTRLLAGGLAAAVLALLPGTGEAQAVKSGPWSEASWILNAPKGDWWMTGRDYALTRFSPLDQISTSNVSQLRPVWSFSTGVLRGHEGNPLVV
jgi:glucose dehydrogenase